MRQPAFERSRDTGPEITGPFQELQSYIKHKRRRHFCRAFMDKAQPKWESLDPEQLMVISIRSAMESPFLHFMHGGSIVTAFNPFSTLLQLIGKKQFRALPLRAAITAQKE